jgi:hypothetical protein
VRILTRLFVQSYLTYYAAIVAVAMLVIAIVEMMVNFEHVIEHGEGIAGAASYLFLRLPSYYLPFVLPVGSFGAAFLCLGLPARAFEILAAKASGIAPARIAAPVLVTAFAFSLLALWLNETVVLRTAQRLDGARDGNSCSSRTASFWYQRGNTLFEVRGADRDTQTLQGVVILRARRAWAACCAASKRPGPHRGRPPLAPRQRAVPRVPARRPGGLAPHRDPCPAWLELGDAAESGAARGDPRGPHAARLRELHPRDRARRAATRHAFARSGTRGSPSAHRAAVRDPAIPLGFSVERARSLAAARSRASGCWRPTTRSRRPPDVVGPRGFAPAVLAPWLVLARFGAFGAWRFARSAS